MSLINQLRPVLSALEDNGITEALSSLPMIADDLTGLIDSLDLDDLDTLIDDALAAAESLVDDEARAAALAEALDDLDGITASATGSEVTVALTAGTDAVVDILDGDIGLGGAAFSLEAQADFSGSIAVAVDVNFSYDTSTDTLTLIDTPQDEVSLSTAISADVSADATIAGGVIAVELTDAMAAPELAISAGFNFASLDPNDITVTYGGTSRLEFDLATVVANGLLPGITATIGIDWDPLDPARAPEITFGDVGISVGELVEAIAEMLDPIADILFEGIIGKIVNIMTEPLPIISDGLNAVNAIDLFDTIPTSGDSIFNLLDGIGLYLQGKGNTQGVQILSNFAEALAILKQLNDFAENDGIIPLGEFSIPGFDADVDPIPAASFTIADIGGQTPLEFLNQLAIDANLFQTVLDSVPGLSDLTSGSLGVSSPSDESGLSFPLFENPEMILNVLLPELTGGTPVPIIQYDIPAISGEARFGEFFFPVFGPFGLTLDGFTEATVDFIVGYDTYALTVEDGTFADGLFLTTQEMAPGEQIERQPDDLQFEYRPIAYATSGVFAGVAVDAVVVRVGVAGGITGFVAAFLPGGEVDTEMGEIPNGVLRLSDFGSGCFLDPILGRIGAEVIASIKIGFGIFSFDYDITIADITLANFEFGCPPATEEIDGLGRYASTSTILFHVGPEIGNRIIEGIADTQINETYRVSQGVDEDGLDVPGALRVEYAGTFQNFGVDDGEAAPTEITADFGDGDDAIVISADLNVTVDVSGGDGLDILEGAALNDELDGGAGNDRLFGRAGNDILTGGDGDDYLEGGLGADTLSGGDGRDRVSYESSAVGVTLLWNGSAVIGSGGEAEGDVLTSIEYIVGSAHDDVLTGNPIESNTLQGNAGDDVLIGGNDDDFLLGDAGADMLLGGAGTDGTSYVTSNDAVIVDLAAGTASGGDAEGDILSSIESVMGSAFYDVLLGDNGDNALAGWIGEDILDGRLGADEVSGGQGDDIVYGRGAGAVLLDGGEGHDLLSYERAGGAVTVDLEAGTGQRSGTDTIGFRQVDDGNGGFEDSIYSSFEDLDGSHFDDTLTGDAQGNTIRGLSGSDTIDGGAGNDILIGGLGADAITGGAGTDWADYTDGDGVAVFLTGGPGTGSTADGDTLTEVENLRGSDGTDFLGGDDGDNILAPMLSGGSLDAVDGLGTDDEDTLQLDYSRNDWGLGVVGGLTLGRFERFAFDGSTLLDGVAFARIENFEITGTMRDDDIETGDGDDRLYLGGGDDTVDSGSGTDTVLAQEGNDTVRYESDDDTPLFLLDGGRDTDGISLLLRDVTEDMQVRAGGDTAINLILSTGASVVNFENLDLIRTGEGADLIEQTGISDNELYGGGNADLIDPGRGIDYVNGGSEIVTTAPSYDVGDRPIYLVTEAEQLLDFVTADVLRLDWSTVSSDISSQVSRYLSGQAYLQANDTTAVSYPFYTQGGFYETADGNDRTDFFGIEAVDITGGSGDDQLAGTWHGLEFAITVNGVTSAPFAIATDRGNDRLVGGAGDDTLLGLTGSDTLIGGNGDDMLYGTGADDMTENFGVGAPGDTFEIDTLTGGNGADRFVLGALDEDNTPLSFYLGRTNANEDATDSRAIITDFDATEGDRLVLAGSSGDYVVETVADGVNILLDQPDRNIIAHLEGVSSLALNSGTAIFRTGFFVPDFPLIPVLPDLPFTPFLTNPVNTPIDFSFSDSFTPTLPTLPTIPTLPGLGLGTVTPVLGQVQTGPATLPLSSMVTSALMTEALSPAEGLGEISADPSLLDPGSLLDLSDLGAPQIDLPQVSADTTAATGKPWIAQTNNTNILANYLFEGVSNDLLQSGTLTLEGDARAFGVFQGDPFDLGYGIVLSTGIVEDIDEPNEEDGGIYGPYAPELTFDNIGEFGGSGIFRADLSFLGTELNSLTIADDGDAIGGGVQAFSGLDLDALVLSRQLVTQDDIDNGFDFNDSAQFETLDVFNYASAYSQYTPGDIRASSGPAVADLNGTQNGLIDLTYARLDAFDFGAGPGGSFTLGDGGTVGFDLTQSVSTDGPLYLYVAEGAANEELEASIAASDTRLAAPADLSTDFGAAGSEGDLTRLTYEFNLFEDAGKMLKFDFSFLTEELREFAGSEFNDALRIFLNGVQLAELSDGSALTVSQLLPAPFAAPHPDLILNPVADGPAKDHTRADAYTAPLTFIGATQYGTNELVIEIEDIRDGLMDSAVLIQGGSIALEDGDDRGVIDLPVNPKEEPPFPAVEISKRVLRVAEGGDKVETEVSLTGIAGLTQEVKVVLTPGTADIDLGSGPGAEHVLVFSPGAALTQTVLVSAPLDNLVELTEVVLASVDVSGAGAFDGTPIAPIVVTVFDTLSQSPTLSGTDDANRLEGTAANETINAFGGDDILIGGLGNDKLNGGDGVDTASYETASAGVEVYLNAGKSRGADGYDTLTEIENLTGSAHDDRLIGDSGDNHLVGGDGADIIKGNGGNDSFDGGAGDDVIRGGAGDDMMQGGDGSDIMFALAGADVLDGGADRDFLYGGRDADTVLGGDGDDEVRGNLGADDISGEAGSDDLRGGGGNDTLDGGADNDFLFGENGADSLHGGAGNDSLTGGMGSGVFDGASDTFIYASSSDGSGGFDRIKDWEDGIDALDLSAFGFTDFAADVLALASDRTGGLRIDFGSGDVLFIEDFLKADFDASDVILT
ncbi:choice-of-anchor L domain-containing protein [Aliishimia ponticola]|nr:choice-of-anchor L domain-containing protein [Aliishimia ponticola]